MKADRRQALAIALAATLLAARPVLAARATMPDALRRLDAAAMALFDAAEDEQWAAAKQALAGARAAAVAAEDDERHYVDAGGQMADFLAARDNLRADLIEAGMALATPDKRWLVACAERIAERAGELSVPFAERDDILAPRLTTLLFLARSIRRAVTWGDADALADAQQEFGRLWRAVRVELSGKAPTESKTLDAALEKLKHSNTTADARALYNSVARLRLVVKG